MKIQYSRYHLRNIARNLINNYHLPIANSQLLTTIWCISIANNAKNQSNYSPIGAIGATIVAIRDVLTRYTSLITRSGFYATWNNLKNYTKTTPFLHHF